MQHPIYIVRVHQGRQYLIAAMEKQLESKKKAVRELDQLITSTHSFLVSHSFAVPTQSELEDISLDQSSAMTS